MIQTVGELQQALSKFDPEAKIEAYNNDFDLPMDIGAVQKGTDPDNPEMVTVVCDEKEKEAAE